ncbi:MAG: FAD-dependent oxidoreductase [Oscillospiraceae bacterium]|nr:FAD-dependent oxidoreductase [Oscillospiraceae bacterium]
MSIQYDLIVVGGGPAGLTAATYARRAGKSVLVLEKAAFGGQITWSPKVENFPGDVSVSGNELGDRFLEQAMSQGAEVELEEVTSVEKTAEGFHVIADSGTSYLSRTVILATGAKPRMLGLPREEEFIGNGISFCAVCDGAFYNGKAVAVYGGGNSALQDALLLSETCSKVYLIHRRGTFRGEAALVDALKARPNVTMLMETTIQSLQGEEELSSVLINCAGPEEVLPIDGLFVAIGHEPDLAAFAPLLSLDQAGYARSGEDCLTPTPGLFVAGDCRAKSVRQVTTAAADGSVAALAACSYLDAV